MEGVHMVWWSGSSQLWPSMNYPCNRGPKLFRNIDLLFSPNSPEETASSEQTSWHSLFYTQWKITSGKRVSLLFSNSMNSLLHDGPETDLIVMILQTECTCKFITPRYPPSCHQSIPDIHFSELNRLATVFSPIREPGGRKWGEVYNPHTTNMQHQVMLFDIAYW